MKRLSANDMRNGIIDAERVAADLRHAEESNKAPSQHSREAARMLVDGFGMKATAEPAPHMKQLHEQFIKAKNGATATKSTLNRLDPSAAPNLPRSFRRFFK